MGREDRRGVHAIQIEDRLLRGLAQGLQRRAALRVDFQREADIAVLDHQTGDHAKRCDVLTPVRIDHSAEGGHHIAFGDLSHA